MKKEYRKNYDFSCLTCGKKYWTSNSPCQCEMSDLTVVPIGVAFTVKEEKV